MGGKWSFPSWLKLSCLYAFVEGFIEGRACDVGASVWAFYGGYVQNSDSVCEPEVEECWFEATVSKLIDHKFVVVDWADGDSSFRGPLPLSLVKTPVGDTFCGTGPCGCKRDAVVADDAAELLRCANNTVPFGQSIGQPGHVHSGISIVMHVSTEVASFGAYSASVNAIYSWKHGHSLVIDARRPAQEGLDNRAAKVKICLDWHLHLWSIGGASWMLWIDADAVFLDLQHDAVGSVVARHEVDQQVQVIVCRARGGGAGNSSLTNTGVMLFRVGEWTNRFLSRWWEDDWLQSGGNDQELFEVLYRRNELGLGDATLLLEPLALNSDDIPISLRASRGQPVYHLYGLPDGPRKDVMRAAAWRASHSSVCGSHSSDDLSMPLVGGTSFQDELSLQGILVASLRKTLSEEHEVVHSGLNGAAVDLRNIRRESRRVLAKTLDIMGHKEDALVEWQRMRDESESFGNQSAHTLLAQGEFARTLLASDRAAEAEAMMIDALSKVPTLRVPTIEVTLLRANIAGLWLQTGRVFEAEIGLRKCLEESKAMESHHVLPILNNLANAIQQQGKHAEAVVLHRRVWKDLRVTIGDDHLMTLKSATNLAQALQVLQQERATAEARSLHRMVLSKRSLLLGADSAEARQSAALLDALS